ncbi:Major Facilitator Superfamily protein [Aphelenchoides fujianensis]|nr:Major Facilitator Superfamily protein [Aphelenchoides fujianensis]
MQEAIAHEDVTCCSCLPNKFRYGVLLISLICLTSISSNTFATKISLYCMSPPANVVINHNIPTYNYSQNEKALFTWATSIGTLVATFPFSWLYGRFSARFVFSGAGITSAVSTALIPLIASLGVWPFTAMCLLQVSSAAFYYQLTSSIRLRGVAYAAGFVLIGVLTSQWASLREHAIFISVLTCYMQISLLITNTSSAFLCTSSLGWPSVFYLHAAAGIVVFGLWLIFYNDSPDLHRCVSHSEMEMIDYNKADAHMEIRGNVPYKRILQNKTVWSSWFCAFGYFFTAFFLHMYLPIYIHFVLGLTVRDAGIYAMIGTFVYIALKLVFAVLSDKITSLTETTKVIIFNTIVMAGPAVLYLFLAFIPLMPTLSIIVIILINAFFAANCGGFYKCATLVSRQYSHFVFAVIQFIKCLCLFLVPTFFDLLVDAPENREDWRSMFFPLAAISIVSALVFWRYADTQPASFTES